MRILVVTLMHAPDGGPQAPISAMLCESLARRGHEVTVITAVPHYPSGQVPQEFRGRWIQRSREEGVEVIRIRVPSIDRANLKLRLLQFICYQVGAVVAGLTRRFDVMLFNSSALESWLIFFILSSLRDTPVISSVQDVYPDVGVKLGIFQHRLVIAMVGWLESFFLRSSKYVRILSESFIQPLLSLGVPEEHMVLIYDWVDTDLIRPFPRNNDFSREHGLGEKFVVLYAGNLGFSQGLEHVLTAAQLLQDRKDIKFVLLGEGAGRNNLMAQAKERQVENVEFLPFQPRSRLPEVLATANVSLVTLKKGIGTASLPSKCYSILASGRPLLASVDVGSGTWNLVQRSGGGICVPPEDSEALAQAIIELQADPLQLELLGRRGRKFALDHHSPQAAAEKFEQLFQAALTSKY